MTETNKMLEECANYLLNHCLVRAVFAPLGYSVVLYPAPLQAAALVNEHEGSQARLLKYESILLLVLRLLYLQKRESLSASADQVLVTVEEVQAELQKMNLPCAGTIWPGRWDGFPGWIAASKYSPPYCSLCRIPTLRTLPPR